MKPAAWKTKDQGNLEREKAPRSASRQGVAKPCRCWASSRAGLISRCLASPPRACSARRSPAPSTSAGVAGIRHPRLARDQQCHGRERHPPGRGEPQELVLRGFRAPWARLGGDVRLTGDRPAGRSPPLAMVDLGVPATVCDRRSALSLPAVVPRHRAAPAPEASPIAGEGGQQDHRVCRSCTDIRGKSGEWAEPLYRDPANRLSYCSAASYSPRHGRRQTTLSKETGLTSPPNIRLVGGTPRSGAP